MKNGRKKRFSKNFKNFNKFSENLPKFPKNFEIFVKNLKFSENRFFLPFFIGKHPHKLVRTFLEYSLGRILVTIGYKTDDLGLTYSILKILKFLNYVLGFKNFEICTC